MTSMPDIKPSPTVHDPIHRVGHAFEREGENLWVRCWFEPGAHLPVRHEVRNTSGGLVIARARVLPAGHLQEFLTDAARAARDGVFTPGGLPTSLRNAVWIAAFAQRHRHETVMTSPPLALQRMVLPILARFAH